MSKRLSLTIVFMLILILPFGLEKATSASNYFLDLDEVPWAEEAIYFLNERGIVKGYGNDKFGSYDNITREQAALMLVRELYPNEISTTELNFPDVKENSIYYNAIAVAVDHELLEGYPDQTFKPQAPITRAETAKILALAYNLKGSDSNFIDLSVAPWAAEYIKALASNNIVIGYVDVYGISTFKPNEMITRAEFSLSLARILDDRFKPKPADPKSCGIYIFDKVHIPDKKLENAISSSIDWRVRPAIEYLTVADMCSLTYLSASNYYDIQDLSGLEYAKYLTDLSLNNDSFTNLSELALLPQLEKLSLQWNSISDISALRELPNLKVLNLSYNSISDISALRELPNLERLYMHSNSVSDIRALSELNNLYHLDLSENSISDISALRELPNLKYLTLYINSITDISVLNELPNLEVVYLGGNDLNSEAKKTIESLRDKGVRVDVNIGS